MSIRSNIILAVILFAVEACLGFVIIGGAALLAALIMLVLFALNRKSFPGILHYATIYALLGIVTQAYLIFNWRVAERRATPIIRAVNTYQSQHNRYPKSLDELVPQFIPAVQRANYIPVGRRFGYSTDPPSLYFPVMFYGVASYDFRTQRWLTND